MEIEYRMGVPFFGQYGYWEAPRREGKAGELFPNNALIANGLPELNPNVREPFLGLRREEKINPHSLHHQLSIHRIPTYP